MAWSLYQQNIFDFVANETGNGIVRAVAGSGKTTTIVEALKRVRGTSIFLAFNKSIADELKKRRVNAKTFHSLTFMPVMRSRGQKEPSMDKLRKIYKQMDFSEAGYAVANPGWYRSFAEKLVGLARQVGIGCLIADTPQAWYDLIKYHDIELENENADEAVGVHVAHSLFLESCASKLVDFDDMLYFAVKDDIQLEKFDFIFVDESQDTNAIQRAILRKIMKPTSRIMFVGDEAQAIYGFRGADSNSMQLLANEFNCTELPLTITYRCAKSVVKYAQKWVGHIEAREDAPEGVVQELKSWSPAVFQPNDLVVCRTTAPILTTAFKCIRAGIPVQVMGRDIGQGLKSLIKQMDATDVDMLRERLEAYMDREVAAAMEKEDEAKAEAISDKVGSLILMIDNLKEGKRSLDALDAGIDYLFKDKENALVLATIHKSKGLEAERVFWLDSSKCPSPWAKQPWQQQQELNLCYVAVTRAKSELYMIELTQAL